MQLEFGEVMRSIREQNKWTLAEMAKKLGTTKQALSKYERGERTPKITVAAKFANILNVPLETLIGYEYHDEEPGEFFWREMHEKHEPDLMEFCELYMNMLPEERTMAMKLLRTMAGYQP